MKTAVEWLFERYVETAGIISTDDLKEALEMEKQQIIDAYNRGDVFGFDELAVDYYKEEYESEG